MNPNLKQRVLELADHYFEISRDIRRHIHKNPELSFEEEHTARFISLRLDEYKIIHDTGIAGHGIVAIIGDPNSENVTSLRADIDALPIQEANEVEYKSQNTGVMHACGHDVHTASLLGTAFILKSLESELQGCVKLIFQPAEERLPGGAKLMIEAGALLNPKPTSIFGQHVHPPLEVGKIGLKPGSYMASADEIYLTVRGRGGHAALPQNTVDTVLVTSHILIALQQVVSRKANPFVPTVLSFGKINSVGGATNIIPDVVEVQGTMRTMNEKWRYEAHDWITKIAKQTAESFGAECNIRIPIGYPALHNDEQLTLDVKKYAIELLGEERVVDLPPRMTAEDFSQYSQHMPACFYRLGTGNKAKGITSPVHTATFDVDEESLRTGIALMAWLAIRKLESEVC